MPTTKTTHWRTAADGTEQVSGKAQELDRTLTWLRDEEAMGLPDSNSDSNTAAQGPDQTHPVDRGS